MVDILRAISALLLRIGKAVKLRGRGIYYCSRASRQNVKKR
jgi:hypothetical protein